MALVAAYHRPESVEQALSLLAAPGRLPLAGGTIVNADRGGSRVDLVDLQALGLGEITRVADGVSIGAMATLADVAACDLVPAWLRAIALVELPSTLRTLATTGGTVASRSGESVLLAALLVCDATVKMAGAEDCQLGDLLGAGVPVGSLIEAVVIKPDGSGALAATGRTPADVPIVAAVARVAGGATTLALTGVGEVPILVDPADPTGGLAPGGDFRGSERYRLELARVLSARALEALR